MERRPALPDEYCERRAFSGSRRDKEGEQPAGSGANDHAAGVCEPHDWDRLTRGLIASRVLPPDIEIGVEECAGDAVRIDCCQVSQDPGVCSGATASVITIFVHGDVIDHFYRARHECAELLSGAIVEAIGRRLELPEPAFSGSLCGGSPQTVIHIGPQDIDWHGPAARERFSQALAV